MLLSSPPLLRPALSPRRIPTLAATRSSRPETRNASSANLSSPLVDNSNLVLHRSQSYISPPPHQKLGFRQDPELGLFSLLFVLSMIAGSFISLAAISLPTLSAFRRLTISKNRLSKVVSEEVPGTLSSLKLSGLEISDLTRQLNCLRQRISGNTYGKKVRTDKAHRRKN